MSAPTSPSATAAEAVGSACTDVRDPAADGSDDVDGVRPGVVARPADVAQVSEVLRAASAHRLSVVPRGAGTKLTWGRPPTSADVLLDLGALDQVLDHAAGDLVVAAQAGTRLAAVQKTVASAGQRLAIDETVPGTTVGGTLATAASGARRVATGAARDLLIGITVVRADGVVAKAGGRVVKNVAGYDLGKLLIGSWGTLAVVVDATFRLHPLPAAGRWVSAVAADPDHADALVRAVVHAQVVPAAVEVEWYDGTGVVSVLLEGREESVAARAETVRGLLDGTPGDDGPPAGGATYPWDPAARGDERRVALKLGFALSGLPDVLRAADRTGAHVRGSAGVGVVHAALPAATTPDDARAALEVLREACTRHRGSAVVLDAPSAVKDALDVWGPVPAIDLMHRVKDQLDPERLLAPGRFVGGI